MATVAFPRRAVAQSMMQRTLAISVYPSPTNFAERRSILQVLEQYGQVDFFKSLPGRDPMFISVMKDEDSMKKLVSLSPLIYVVSVPTTKQLGLRDLIVPDKFSNTRPSATPKGPDADISESSQTGQAKDTVEKEFVMNATPNPRYRHRMTGAEQSLQRSWPKFYDDNNSFTTQILKQSLPDTLAAKGLAHWNVDLGQKENGPVSDAKAMDRMQLQRWIPTKIKTQNLRKNPPVDEQEAPTTLDNSRKKAHGATEQVGDVASQ